MATIKGLYRCIDACNGEIRLISARYEEGWYCLIIIQEQFDNTVFDKFEDLICGDNDHFEARDFFKKHNDDVVLARGYSPEDALSIAADLAAKKLEGYEDE